MAFNGKSSYSTFSKWLDEKGIDKSKLSDSEKQALKAEYDQTKWWKAPPQYQGGNGKHQTNNFNAPQSNPSNPGDDDIKPAEIYSDKNVKALIEFDLKRESLKKNEPKVNANKSANYVDLSTPEEKEETKETELSDAQKAEQEKKRQEEEKFKNDWAWFDGATIIWGLEMMNLEFIPKICSKRGKQCPTPDEIVYTERAKQLMKPGMDVYAEKIKHLFKRPEYLAIGVALVHPFMLIKNAKPLPTYDTFNPQNDDEPLNPDE